MFSSPAIPEFETSPAVLNPGFEAKSNQYTHVFAYSKDPESQSNRTVSLGIPQAFKNKSG